MTRKIIVKSGYGLFHKKSKSIVGVTSDFDNSGESVGTYYTLSYNQEPLWIVKDKIGASYVRLNSTEWYNAGYDTPINPYEPEELQVIKIELQCEIEEPYPIPTFEEYMKRKYLTEGSKSYDPNWYNHIMEQRKMWDHDYGYSLYDLRNLLGEYDD
jgi:hypothetical protein